MQKTNTKASILIWAIFLSLIISVTFIGISTKINKNLKNNSNFLDRIKVNNQIKNIINSGSINGNLVNQYLLNGDKIIFNPSYINIAGLKQGEIYKAKINTGSTITIKILEGGPIKYKNNTASGLIINSSTFTVTTGDTVEVFNLGGYSRIQISSNKETNYLSDYRNYYIIKDIGNKEIIKSKGKIKNF